MYSTTTREAAKWYCVYYCTPVYSLSCISLFFLCRMMACNGSRGMSYCGLAASVIFLVRSLCMACLVGAWMKKGWSVLLLVDWEASGKPARQDPTQANSWHYFWRDLVGRRLPNAWWACRSLYVQYSIVRTVGFKKRYWFWIGGTVTSALTHRRYRYFGLRWLACGRATSCRIITAQLILALLPQKDRFFFERRRKIRILLSYTLPTTALSILYGVPGRSTVLPYRTSLVLQRKLCTYHPTTKSQKAERFVSSHNSAQKHHRQTTKCVVFFFLTSIDSFHLPCFGSCNLLCVYTLIYIYIILLHISKT